MKPFEYYLEQKDVKKNTKNPALAKALIKDMFVRIAECWDENEDKKPKTIFENIYDALRDFCDALLALNGYKSYSHEASISYLIKQDFDIFTVNKLDNFRYIRNGSKYYGRIITPEDVKEIKKFYLSVKEKINKIIKDKSLDK